MKALRILRTNLYCTSLKNNNTNSSTISRALFSAQPLTPDESQPLESESESDSVFDSSHYEIPTSHDNEAKPNLKPKPTWDEKYRGRADKLIFGEEGGPKVYPSPATFWYCGSGGSGGSFPTPYLLSLHFVLDLKQAVLLTRALVTGNAPTGTDGDGSALLRSILASFFGSNCTHDGPRPVETFMDSELAISSLQFHTPFRCVVFLEAILVSLVASLLLHLTVMPLILSAKPTFCLDHIWTLQCSVSTIDFLLPVEDVVASCFLEF